jgi:arylsulfatase A-like enzyme
MRRTSLLILMKPNIIVLLLDTARADHLSPYGYSRDTTPFLDEFNKESVTYDRAYSSSIWSLPAYASLFTGERPSEHGAIDWGKAIEENRLVNEFNDSGYDTYAVSPHLISGEHGIKQSFDKTVSVSPPGRDLPFEPDPVAERVQRQNEAGGWESTLQKYSDIPKWIISERHPQTVINGLYHLYRQFRWSRGQWPDNGAADVINNSIKMIENADQPFFLFANFIEPHEPYRPPSDYVRQFVSENVGFSELNRIADISTVPATLGVKTVTDHQRDLLKSLYDAELYYLDSQLSRLYDSLRTAGELNNTVIVVLSDHGDLFGEWELWGHQGRIHHSLCRIPLMIRYPWETGSCIDSRIVEIRSLFDHLLHLTESQQSDPRIESTGNAAIEYYGWDSHLFSRPWEQHPDVDVSGYNCYQASLVTDQYHLLWDANDRIELYHVESDPSEDTNLSQNEPGVVSRLCDDLRITLGDPTNVTYESEAKTIDPETQEKLKDLGYL